MSQKRTKIQVYDVEKMKELLSQIDWISLNEKISEVVGIPMVSSYELTGDDRFPRVCVSCSENVAEHTGFLKNCFEKVIIKDFGAILHKIVEFDSDELEEYRKKGDWDSIDAITENVVDYCFHISIDARIYLKNGGENGLHLFSATYSFETGSWTFE